MHEHELVAIWFLAVSMGVILTMLMPRMVSAPSRRGRIHVGWNERSAQDEFNEQMGSVVLMGKVPDVYVVSTSWAWGIPQAVREHEGLGHDQAHLMGPPAVQQANATDLKTTEIGGRGELIEQEHVGNAS